MVVTWSQASHQSHLLLDKYWPIFSWLFHSSRCRANTFPSLMKDRLWFRESLAGQSEAMSRKNLQMNPKHQLLSPVPNKPNIAAFLPSCRIKISLHKVIKRPHVFLFCKQNMVGDTLENLWTFEKWHWVFLWIWIPPVSGMTSSISHLWHKF